MRATVSAAARAARIAIPAPESNSGITLASESENENEWFFKVAHEVFGKDAGLHLHLLTGYPQSSCYAYVAKDKAKRRRPPEHFLRVLFKTEEGESFHTAFMRGNESAWWLTIVKHDIAARAFVREMESM